MENNKYKEILKKIEENKKLDVYFFSHPEKIKKIINNKSITERELSFSVMDENLNKYMIFVNEKISPNPYYQLLYELGNIIKQENEIEENKPQNTIKNMIKERKESWEIARELEKEIPVSYIKADIGLFKKMLGEKVKHTDEMHQMEREIDERVKIKKQEGESVKRKDLKEALDYSKELVRKEKLKNIKYLSSRPKTPIHELIEKNKGEYNEEVVKETIKKPAYKLRDEELINELNFYKAKNNKSNALLKSRKNIVKEEIKRRKDIVKRAIILNNIENKDKKSRYSIKNRLIDILNGIEIGLLKNNKNVKHPNQRYEKQIAWDFSSKIPTLLLKKDSFSQPFMKEQKSYFQNMFGIEYGRGRNKKVYYNNQVIADNIDDFLVKATLLDSMFDYIKDDVKNLVGQSIYNKGISLFGKNEFEQMVKNKIDENYRSAWLVSQLYMSGSLNNASFVQDIHKKANLSSIVKDGDISYLTKAETISKNVLDKKYTSRKVLKNELKEDKLFHQYSNEELKKVYDKAVKEIENIYFKQNPEILYDNIDSHYLVKQKKSYASNTKPFIKGFDKWKEDAIKKHAEMYKQKLNQENLVPSKQSAERKHFEALTYISSDKEVSGLRKSVYSPNYLNVPDVIDYHKTKDGYYIPRSSDLIIEAKGIETYQRAKEIKYIQDFYNKDKNVIAELEKFVEEEKKKGNRWIYTYNSNGEEVLALIDENSGYVIPDEIKVEHKPSKQTTMIKGQENLYVLTDVGVKRLEHIQNEKQKIREQRKMLTQLKKALWDVKDKKENETVNLSDDLKKFLDLEKEEISIKELLDKAVSGEYVYEPLKERANITGYEIVTNKTPKENMLYTSLNFIDSVLEQTKIQNIYHSYETTGIPNVSYAKELEIERVSLLENQSKVSEKRKMYKQEQTDYGTEARNMTPQEAKAYLKQLGLWEEDEITPFFTDKNKFYFEYTLEKAFLNVDVDKPFKYVEVVDEQGNKKWSYMATDEMIEEMKKQATKEHLPEARPQNMLRSLLSVAFQQGDIQINDESSIGKWKIKLIDVDGNEYEETIRHYDVKSLGKTIEKMKTGERLSSKEYAISQKIKGIEQLIESSGMYQKEGDRVLFKPKYMTESDKIIGIVRGEKDHILASNIKEIKVKSDDLKTLTQRYESFKNYIDEKLLDKTVEFFEEKELELQSKLRKSGPIEVILTKELADEKFNGKRVLTFKNAEEATESIWRMLSEKDWSQSQKKKGHTTTGLEMFGDKQVMIPKPILNELLRTTPTTVRSIAENGQNPREVLSFSYLTFADSILKQNGVIDLNKAMVDYGQKIKVDKTDFAGLFMRSIHDSLASSALSFEKEYMKKGNPTLRYQPVIKEFADMMKYTDEKLYHRSYEELSGLVYDALKKSNVSNIVEKKYKHMEGVSSLTEEQVRAILRQIDEQHYTPLSLDKINEIRERYIETVYDAMGDTTSYDMQATILSSFDENDYDLLKYIDLDKTEDSELNEIEERVSRLKENLKRTDIELKTLLASGRQSTEGMDKLGSSMYRDKLDAIYGLTLLKGLKENKAIDEKTHERMLNEWKGGGFKLISLKESDNVDWEKAYNTFYEFIHGNEEKQFHGFGHDVFYRLVDPSMAEMFIKHAPQSKEIQIKKVDGKYNPYEHVYQVAKLKEIFPHMQIEGIDTEGRKFSIELGKNGQIEALYHDTGRYKLIVERKKQAEDIMSFMDYTPSRVQRIKEKSEIQRDINIAPKSKTPIVYIPDVNYENLVKIGPQTYMEHSPAESFVGLNELKYDGKIGIVTDFETLMLPNQVTNPLEQAWIMESTMQDVKYTNGVLSPVRVQHHVVRPTEKVSNWIKEKIKTLDTNMLNITDPYNEQKTAHEIKQFFDKNPELSALRNVAKYAPNAKYNWADYSNKEIAKIINQTGIKGDSLLKALQEDAEKGIEFFEKGTEEEWKKALNIGDDVEFSIVDSPIEWEEKVVPRLTDENAYVIGQNIVGAEHQMIEQQRKANALIREEEKNKQLMNDLKNKIYALEYEVDESNPRNIVVNAEREGSYNIVNRLLKERDKKLEKGELFDEVSLNKGFFKHRMHDLISQSLSDEFFDSPDFIARPEDLIEEVDGKFIIKDKILNDLYETVKELNGDVSDLDDIMKKYVTYGEEILTGEKPLNENWVNRFSRKLKAQGLSDKEIKQAIEQSQEQNNRNALKIREKFLSNLEKSNKEARKLFQDAMLHKWANEITQDYKEGRPITFQSLLDTLEDVSSSPTIPEKWMKEITSQIDEGFGYEKALLSMMGKRNPKNDLKPLFKEIKQQIKLEKENINQIINQNKSAREEIQKQIDSIKTLKGTGYEPKSFKAIEMMHIAKHLYPELQQQSIGFNMGSLVEHVLKEKDPEAYEMYKSQAHTAYTDTITETKLLNTMLSDLKEIPQVKFLEPGEKVIRLRSYGDVGERGLYEIVGYKNENQPTLQLKRIEVDSEGKQIPTEKIAEVVDVSEEALRRKFARNFIPLPDGVSEKDYLDQLAWDDAREDILSATQGEGAYHSMLAQKQKINQLEEMLNERGKEFNVENLLELAKENNGQIFNKEYQKAFERFNELTQMLQEAEKNPNTSIDDVIDNLSMYDKQLLENKHLFTDEERIKNNLLFPEINERRARAIVKSKEFFDSNHAKIIEHGLSQIEDLRTSGLANEEEVMALTRQMNEAIRKKAEEKGRVKRKTISNSIALTLDSRFKDLEGRNIIIRTDNVQQITQSFETPLSRMINSEIGREVKEFLTQKLIQDKESPIKTPTEEMIKSELINKYMIPFIQEKLDIPSITFKSNMESPQVKLDHLSQAIYNQQFKDGGKIMSYVGVVDDITQPFTKNISVNMDAEDIEEADFVRELNNTRAEIITNFIQNKYERSTVPSFLGRDSNTTPAYYNKQFMDFQALQYNRSELKQMGEQVLPGQIIKPIQNNYKMPKLGITKDTKTDNTFYFDKFSNMQSNDLEKWRETLFNALRNKEKKLETYDDVKEYLTETMNKENGNEAVHQRMREMIEEIYQKANEKQSIRKHLMEEALDTYKESYERLMKMTPTDSGKETYIHNLKEMVDYHIQNKNEEALNLMRGLNWINDKHEITPVENRIFPIGKETSGKRMKNISFKNTSYYENKPILYNMIKELYNPELRLDNLNNQRYKSDIEVVEIKELKDNIEEVPIEENIEKKNIENNDIIIDEEMPTKQEEPVIRHESWESDEPTYVNKHVVDDLSPKGAIQRGIEETKKIFQSKWGKVGALGLVGAFMAYEMLHQPDILEKPKDVKRVPLESRENEAYYMNEDKLQAPPLRIPEGQGVKQHPVGYDIKIGGYTNHRIDPSELSNQIQTSMQDRLSPNARVTINTTDDTRAINRQWVEKQISDFIENGYAGGM
ncbi:MAG: hypothetical protein N2043_02180 [Ignavibacterium sp.]|nr:hypothetical protein [Ignavibacterium sp.]